MNNCKDCLRVAIGVLIIVVVFNQVISPEKYDKRLEFMRFVYSANSEQQRAILNQLWHHPIHNHWKDCKDTVIPVCKDIRKTVLVGSSVRLFCKDLWDYCRRYDPDTANTPEY